MKFRAEINVMPLKELLDPQGKAVASSIQKMEFKEVSDVRIGKHITLHLESNDKSVAEQKVDEACKKVLSNPVMEYYEFELFEEA